MSNIFINVAGFFSSSNGGSGIVGNGKLTKQNRDLRNFTSVIAMGSVDITITCGKDYSVSVEAEENILPLISTKVANSALSIEISGSFTLNKKAKLHISLPTLLSIKKSGSGDFNVEALSGKTFEAVVSGSGDSRFHGIVERSRLKTSGSGDINAKYLNSVHVELDCSGSGKVDVNCLESLKYSKMGSGDLNVYGSPRNVVGDSLVREGYASDETVVPCSPLNQNSTTK